MIHIEVVKSNLLMSLVKTTLLALKKLERKVSIMKKETVGIHGLNYLVIHN